MGFGYKTLYLSILILILYTVVGCVKIDTESVEDTELMGLPDQELFGAKIIYSQASYTKLTLEAPQLMRFEANDLMLMYGGIKAEVFDEYGAVSAVITAEEGDILEQERKLTARGDVIVNSVNGMTLYADTLKYDDNLGKIFSDGFVKIVTELDSLTGTGFSASPNLSNWELKQTSGATWRDKNSDRK